MMLTDPARFYASVRSRLGKLTQFKVDGFEAILPALDGLPLAHAAYALATAWHETASTMQPVIEAYWKTEAWRKKNLRYYPWYGRGYTQITWEPNYAKADREAAAAGLIKPGEMLANPALALRPDIAAFIMRRGMEEGWFTGKSLRTYLPFAGVATREQYMRARRIINGIDKSDLIEDYAQAFERALQDGGWA